MSNSLTSEFMDLTLLPGYQPLKQSPALLSIPFLLICSFCSLSLIWGWRCPVPCLGRNSVCCYTLSIHFLVAFLQRRNNIYKACLLYQAQDYGTTLYDRALVSHGQDTIQKGTKGFPKKCFQGDGMHCSPAARWASILLILSTETQHSRQLLTTIQT